MVENPPSATGPRLVRTLTAHQGLPLLGALAALALALTLALFAPGFMARDSGTQLEQARALQLNDAHPVLMALIWRVTDAMLPGPLGMLVLTSTLHWAGLALLFWALPGPLAARAFGLLAAGFFPPIFTNVPIILKDTLMQGGLMVGLGLLLAPTRRGRRARIALAGLFFLLAIGARHNAIAAVWPLGILALLPLPLLAHRPRWLRLGLAAGASLVLTLGLAQGWKAALSTVSKSEHLWQYVTAFDLAGMSLRTGKLLVPPNTGVLTPGMGLDEIRQLYRSDYALRLWYCIPFQGQECQPVFNRVMYGEQLDNLARSWRQAVAAHPRAYLGHRLEMGGHLLGLSGPKQVYYLGGAPHHRLARDYSPRPLTLRALAWVERQLTWVGFRPWVFVSILLIVLPVALVRFLRSGRWLLPLLYALSGLSYFLSFLVAASSPDYRYTVWTITCAVLAAITLLAREREREPEPPG